MSSGEALTVDELPTVDPPRIGSSTSRIAVLVAEHSAFLWRSLVRLGVPRADAEDALQQVFLVAARRLGDIEVGREPAFLFSTALRIASRARRTQQRRREVLESEPAERIDPAPDPEELVDHTRARAELDRILDTMPLDVRAVFVLFEIEQVTMPEIGALLDLPVGTVASRLRRAREHFQAAVKRLSMSRNPRGKSA